MGISSDNRYDVIVVGAGLGGLSCALHFAKAGFHVLVLEKQPKVGGYCQNYQRGEYSFDVSLHVLSAMNEEGGLYRLLEYLQVVDRLDIVRHDPMFTSVFPDATYRLPGGAGPAADYLKSRFPSQREGIDRFVGYMDAIVSANTDLFWNGVPDLDDFFPSRYFKKTYTHLLNDCFDDRRLHGLLGQLWQSTGLPNDRCAANWAAEVFGSHLLTGNYYIRGGGQRLSVAMAQTLREAGSVVKTSSLVTRILHEDRTVTGVELASSERFHAPVVVCNANPLQTYRELIGEEHLSAAYRYKLAHLEQSCSLLTLYLGLDCPGAEAGVADHTLFVNESYDNARAFDLAMAEEYDRTDYVISDYTEEAVDTHPPGRGIVQILEVAPGEAWTGISREAYEDKKAEVTDTILRKVGARYPDLERHIAACELGTPRTMQLATRNPAGSVYGWAQTPDQADNHRFGTASIFRGLHFTGAWCRGGGGGYMGAIVNGRVAFTNAMAREGLVGTETMIRTTAPRGGGDGGREIARKGDFSMERYELEIGAGDVTPLNELSGSACVRLLQAAADRYAAERADLLTGMWPDLDAPRGYHVSFFQMRFVFVPFVEAAAGRRITVEVELEPKGPGKGEFTLNILSADGKKMANAGGRALFRPRASS